MTLARFQLGLSVVRNLIAGRAVFDVPNYRDSELTRLLNLFAHIDASRWQGMRVLEVGAGYGRIGEVFEQLGFDVTSTDGRAEHVERMNSKGRRAHVLDLDQGEDLTGGYDLVLAFGVLYHLSRPDSFIKRCGEAAKVLVLETVVCDDLGAVLRPVTEPSGWRGKDQALHHLGCRPSPLWVEECCRTAGFDLIRDISSSVANWKTGSYDWTPRGTGEWRRNGVNLRKMWVCEKTSPQTVLD
jgi:SAM-dependent methyltransferase